MTLGNLKLYDIFRNDLHLPDNKAMEFVTALDELSEKHVSRQNELLATKEELLTTKSELKAEMLAIKSELKQELHTVATRVDYLSEKMASKVDLAEAKSELKNHFLTVTLVQLVVIIGTILTIVRYALMK